MVLDLSGFSANIISDLGPLLALFGEQVSRQFMSESMGWSDNILFAMAPLGIVTAIVGAIRIGAPNWMRAVIGRARENIALPEIELMSSTSHEVCELWNGQQIVRIMGAPPIKEILCIKRKEDLGLYTLREARWNWQEGEPGLLIEDKGDALKCFMRKFGESTSEFFVFLTNWKNNWKRHSGDTENFKPKPNRPRSQPVAEAPNISLNINTLVSRWELRFFATIATMLQTAVLAYANFATSDHNLKNRFTKIGQYTETPWGVFFTITGTIAVVAGMLICAFIIENSTIEERYRTTEADDRVYVMWIQKAATVSDQVFGSHAIFGEESRQIISSSRRNQKYLQPGHSFVFEGLTVAGVVVSLVGFLVQIIGFRGMHWSVPVAQLGATIITTAIRAWVRRGLSAPPHVVPLPVGYEIDWLATRVAQDDDKLWDRRVWRGDGVPHDEEYWEEFAGQGVYRWDIVTGASSPGYKPLHDVTIDAKGAEVSRNNTIDDPERRMTLPRKSSVGHGAVVVGGDRCRAQMVLDSRKDLGRLTKWPGPAADKATSVAKAIEIVLENTQTRGFEVGSVLNWNLRTFTTCRETVSFEIRYTHDGWKVNVADIEAALSLWLFAASEKEKLTSTMDDESDKNAWLRSGKASRRDSLRLLGASNTASRRDMRWWAGKGNSRLIEVSAESGKYVGGKTIELSSHRIVGFGGDIGEVETEDGHVRENKAVEGKRRAGQPETRVYRMYEVSDDTDTWPTWGHEDASRKWGGLPTFLDSSSELGNGRISLSEENKPRTSLASDRPLARGGTITPIEDNEMVPPLTPLGGRNFPPIMGRNHSLAILTSIPLESVFAIDIFSAFMWAYAQTPGFERISGETTLQQPDRVISGGETSWPSFTLKNSTLSKIVEDVSRTGLASVTEVYISIIPPLSAYRRLPDAGAAIEFARQQARLYESSWDWRKASRCHLWAMATCEPFDPNDEAAVYATASLTEYLRSIKLSADIMAKQNYSPKEIQWLRHERERLARILCEFCDHATRQKIAHVYHIQGRAEGYDTWNRRGSSGNLTYGPCMPFKFNRIHLALTTGGFTAIRKTVNINLRKKLDEIRKEVNEKDVLGWTPLHYAVRGTDYHVVKELLRWGADWRIQNIAEATPLHFAATSKMPLWRLLRQDKVDVHLKGRGGLTPLHCAARSNNLLMAKVLIEYGANTKSNDNYRRTPLHWAAYSGSRDVARLLLQKGADIEASDHIGRTALHLAAMCGHLEVSELILAGDSDIDPMDYEGSTPIQIAAKAKHNNVVDLLKIRGANMSERPDEYYSALQAATVDKDISSVEKLLSGGADVNCKPGKWGSALHAAIRTGNKELVELFLGRGAEMDVVDSEGDIITALEVAARTGYVSIVELLISKNADPKNTNALQSAARTGHKNVVELLISQGVDQNVQDKNGVTALHAAAEAGHYEVVSFLISNGADLRAKNHSGGTILEAAAGMGHDRIVDLLISNGPDIVELRNGNGETPLYTAAHGGKTSVLMRLLDDERNINRRSNSGQTVLHAAAQQKNPTIVLMLLECGADPAIKDKNGDTAIQIAGKSGNEVIARLLLSLMATDDKTDKNGETALQVAARAGDEEMVTMLLSRGVNVDFRNRVGETALQMASREGHYKVLKLLLAANANVDLCDDQGRTALQVAAKAGHELMLNLLLAYKIDLNIKDKEGKTALLLAAAAGHQRVVRRLADLGADINIRDKTGQTALFAAATAGHEEVISVLLGYIIDIPGQQDVYDALSAAVGGGHTKVVIHLLDAGATVDPDNGELLEAAVFTGNDKIVQLLLEHGVHADALGGKYGSALRAATSPRNSDDQSMISVIEMLLDHGANIDGHSDEHCSALQKAALEGQSEVIQLLLDNGADINCQGGKSPKALQGAVSRGNVKVVQLLLGSGADVNAESGHNGTPLQAAAASRNVEMVQLLLDNGANVNAPGYNHSGNALQLAVSGGAIDVVELLIEKGADVNVSGGEHGTPLAEAAFNGYVEIVQLLLENGADIHASCGRYGSALAQATQNGNVKVVEILLGNGANVNEVGGEYGSALMQAARNGYFEIMKMLLERGVDTSALSDACKTAEEYGCSDVVELLRKHGA